MVAIAAVIGIASASTSLDDARSIVADRAAKLTRDSAWKSAGARGPQVPPRPPHGPVQNQPPPVPSPPPGRTSDKRRGGAHPLQKDQPGAGRGGRPGRARR